jgi:hypothetical protein
MQLSELEQVRYLTDASGQQTDVLVPIGVWQRLVMGTSPEPREPVAIEDDPLVGMFTGPKDLAEKSEEILAQEIRAQSGWSWKE